MESPASGRGFQESFRATAETTRTPSQERKGILNHKFLFCFQLGDAVEKDNWTSPYQQWRGPALVRALVSCCVGVAVSQQPHGNFQDGGETCRSTWSGGFFTILH